MGESPRAVFFDADLIRGLENAFHLVDEPARSKIKGYLSASGKVTLNPTKFANQTVSLMQCDPS